jgi:hypothetical protein
MVEKLENERGVEVLRIFYIHIRSESVFRSSPQASVPGFRSKCTGNGPLGVLLVSRDWCLFMNFDLLFVPPSAGANLWLTSPGPSLHRGWI